MRTKYSILIVLTMTIYGCENLSLDLAPVSSITSANYWRTPEQFETFITGIHGRLREHSFSLNILGEFRADIYGEQSFSGGSVTYERYHLSTLNSEYTGITNFAGLYSNINQINLLIYMLNSTDLLSESKRDYMLGQAYGIRAFYYFHLLRSWGEVVLVSEPMFSYTLDNLAKPASPIADVMEFIKNDIEKSDFSFSEDLSFKDSDKCFWSKSATLMLKSEVYLWASKQMDGGYGDALIAKNTLIEIQNRVPSLNLLSNFSDIFSYGNKGNSEIIFSLRNRLNEYTLFGSNLFDQFLPRVASVENYYDSITNSKLNAVAQTILTTSGGHYVAVNKSIFRQFSDLDTRKLASIGGAYSLVDGHYVLQNGCWVNKYKGVFDLGIRQMVDDYPIYRYADLLLMLAEAKVILNEDPSNEINLIRKRAFSTNYHADIHGFPNQKGDGNIEEALLRERLFEFICEGKRWYDLRRFGKEYVIKYTNAKQDYQLLWPIDRSTLTNNRLLTQTSGY